MDAKEIEAIVKDTVNFVDEEFFETTKGEKSDLAAFLRERLAQAPAQPAPGVSVTFRRLNGELNPNVANLYDLFPADDATDHSDQYYPAAQVADGVNLVKQAVELCRVECGPNSATMDMLLATLARFEGGQQ